jgi:hypothetical protein
MTQNFSNYLQLDQSQLETFHSDFREDVFHLRSSKYLSQMFLRFWLKLKYYLKGFDFRLKGTQKSQSHFRG